MAKEEKKKKVMHTTPRGIAIYPRIDKPDFGNDEYPDPAGSFKTNLKIKVTDATDLIKLVDDLHEEAKAKIKELEKKHKADPKKKGKPFKTPTEHSPYYMETDDDGETGYVIFKFKSKASGESKKDGSKWERKIPVFDSIGKPLSPVPAIGGGSTLRVSFTADSYASAVGFGVSLRLEAVKLLDLQQFGGGSADSYGFGEEEEGFEAEDETDTTDSDDGEAEDTEEVDF